MTAVEPDDRMRAVLSPRRAGSTVLEGQAEELPAPSSSFDVVIAASAWHWVDEERAVPEVARVLRPARAAHSSGADPIARSTGCGRSGLEASCWPRAQDAVDARRRRRHLVNLDAGGTNPFLQPETAIVRWIKPMTATDLVAFSTTYSVVITMDDTARGRHLDAMARFLDTHEPLAGLDIVDVPMRSYCWRANKR